MANDLPKISGIDPLGAPKSVEPSGGSGSNNGQTSFSSYMKEGSSPSTSTPGVSPMDLAQVGNRSFAQPTPESILAQMNSASGVLGDMQNQLNMKNLRLKPSQKYLLRSKLGESNELFRQVSGKFGVTTGEPPSGLSRQGPIARFLALLEDSQTQLDAAQNKIREMKEKGKQLAPGDYLLVQVKISRAQQELEYCSVLLSNAVSDIKTLFNIQI